MGGPHRPEVREARKLDKFAALFDKFDDLLGTEKEERVTKDELKIIAAKNKVDSTDDLAVEAEATLLYYHTKGKGFIRSICPQCSRPFAYKYSIPGIKLKCSNKCRADALAEIGITWNYLKSPEERWGVENTGGAIPLVVPPDAFSALEEKMKSEDVHKTDQNEQLSHEKSREAS